MRKTAMADRSPIRLLAVDDDPAALEIVSAMAEREGFQFNGYPTGQAGIASLSEIDPDVVCLDVDLPDTSGFDLCARIKSDPRTRFLPVLIITAENDRESRMRGIEAGCDDFLTKPIDRLELAARARVLARVRRLSQDLEDSERIIQSLGLSVEARDPTTGNHCERVGALAAKLGQRLNVSDDSLVSLRQAGFLHDIGKIGVPDSVLLKAGSLDEVEWVFMRRHPEIGVAIIAPLRTLGNAVPIVRHHHERWDGAGYPAGLRGDAIPFEARLFQVVDAFDALTNRRPYRAPIETAAAIGLLRKEAGQGKWERGIVDVFAEYVGRAQLRS